MTRTRRRPIVVALFLALALPARAAVDAPAPATAPPPAQEPPPDGVAVHVALETFGIDRKGTWSAGADEADLMPRTAGVLEKVVTLVAKDSRRTSETVRVRTRVVPDASPPDGAACALHVEFDTRRETTGAGSSQGKGRPEGARAGAAAAGGAERQVDHREASVTLAEGEERLLEAYASSLTSGRVAVKVRCQPSSPESGTIPDLVTIDLTVEKSAEGEPPEVLRSQRLLAAMGREAGAVVTANATLADDADGGRRYRRERIETSVTPMLIVAGRMQVAVHVGGEIATVSASGAEHRYPIDRSETFIVSSGEPRSFDIQVSSGGADEGWTHLTLSFGVTARF
jgi:hypothetical protein